MIQVNPQLLRLATALKTEFPAHGFVEEAEAPWMVGSDLKGT